MTVTLAVEYAVRESVRKARAINVTATGLLLGIFAIPGLVLAQNSLRLNTDALRPLVALGPILLIANYVRLRQRGRHDKVRIDADGFTVFERGRVTALRWADVEWAGIRTDIVDWYSYPQGRFHLVGQVKPGRPSLTFGPLSRYRTRRTHHRLFELSLLNVDFHDLLPVLQGFAGDAWR